MKFIKYIHVQLHVTTNSYKITCSWLYFAIETYWLLINVHDCLKGYEKYLYNIIFNFKKLWFPSFELNPDISKGR